MHRVALLVIMISFGWVGEAAACSCASNPPPLEALAEADAVFYGRVLERRHVETADSKIYVEARLEVLRLWKGAFLRETVVRTSTSSCGVYFRQGDVMLIYAHVQDGALFTHLCTRTVDAAFAGADLEALGPPLYIFDEGYVYDDRPDGGLCGGPDNLATLQGMVFLFLALGCRRRRRPLVREK